MTVTTPNLDALPGGHERETLHRIGDFVPILVERLAREDLANVAAGKRWSRTDVRELIRSMRRQGAW